MSEDYQNLSTSDSKTHRRKKADLAQGVTFDENIFMKSDIPDAPIYDLSERKVTAPDKRNPYPKWQKGDDRLGTLYLISSPTRATIL